MIRYNLIFFYYGLAAMLAQLALFRELSVLFYANELFLGTFLSSWLFWVGLGSLLAKRLPKVRQFPKKYFSSAFFIISLLLPFTILLIRISKSVFSFGEFIGPLGATIFTFVVMSVLCFVFGAQFSLACAIASDKMKKKTALGRVYLFEALGSVAGGALFTYMLIGKVPIFFVVLILSFGCILAGRCISANRMKRDKVLRRGLSLTLVAAALVAWLFINLMIEPAVNKAQWRKYQFIRQKETRNETLSLVKMGSIKNVFVDGILSASFPGEENYEPAAHWPLLATASPERILVIGDASLGVLKEALKHDPKSVDYAILDGSFLELVKPFLLPEDIRALNDPRVSIHFGDPRLFVNKAEKNRYDCVIINIQEVPNLRLNRFYTREFYWRIKSMLKPEGVLGLGIVSSENYLSERTRKFNSSVYKTLKSVFGEVEVVPGDSLILLCGPSAIDMRKNTILGRFNDRKIANRYFIPSYIEYRLEVKRRAELKSLLEGTRRIGINIDFSPTTCYYFTGFWLDKFTSAYIYLAGGVLLSIVILAAIRKRGSLSRFARKKEWVILFTFGFVGILLEVVLLLSFQVISGYVYWQIGALFASFMSGLFLGAALAALSKDTSERNRAISIVILSLAVIGLSAGAGHLLPGLASLPTALNIIIFLALLVCVGTASGAVFIISGFLDKGDEIMAKAGGLYASDLWGAGLGAILSTNLIVPFFGLLGSFYFAAVAAAAGLGLFLILSKDLRCS